MFRVHPCCIEHLHITYKLGWLLVLTTPPEACDWGVWVQTYSAPVSERVEEKVWKENVSLKTTWRRRAEMTTALQAYTHTHTETHSLVMPGGVADPDPFLHKFWRSITPSDRGASQM